MREQKRDGGMENGGMEDGGVAYGGGVSASMIVHRNASMLVLMVW